MDLSSKQGRREQGLRIQGAVERAGISIEELAGRIGCSRALIYQYLSGSTLAQPDRLQQIASECGVELTYFYQDFDSPVQTQAPGEAAPVVESQDVTARLSQTLRTLNELADAQESPPDYRALASTCERIHFIAGQLGERAAQGRVQLRLGNALLRTADYNRAAEALRGAIEIAGEVGAAAMENDARQSLGNALLSTGDLAGAREQFSAIAAGEQLAGRWKGTLSLGSVHTMLGEYREAMQRFDDAATILEDAEANGAMSAREAAVGLLYVNGNRVNVYLNGGDFQGARPIIEKCLETAEAYGIASEHLEAKFDLAWCDFNAGRWGAAYRSLNSVLQLSRFVGDQGHESMARAWLGILLASAGDFPAAISYGKDALSLALSRGDRRGELYGQLALADAYTGHSKRESEARYHANQALAVATSLKMDRGEAECRLRVARLAAQAGDAKEEAEAAARARALAEKLGARHLESLALTWQADAALRGGGADGIAAENAAAALKLANALGLSEGMWRARSVLARSADDDGAAIGHLKSAVAVLGQLRAQLLEAGVADTLLENDECLAQYEALIRRTRKAGDIAAADALLEQAGWLPLEQRLRTGSPADSHQS